MQYSIVNYKTVKEGEGALRLDSEHYRKTYLDIKRIMENKKFYYLSEILSKPIVTGHTPSMANESYYGGRVAFVKTDNVREHNITDNFNHYLSNEGNKKIQRSQLKSNDVLLTIIGASFDVVGRASLVTEEILPANINQNIARIRVNENVFDPKVLAVYLNSSYGRNYLYFLSRQTEQVNLNNKEVERLIIPHFSKSIIGLISKIVEKSYQLKQNSKSLYSQAEQLLLSELGLLDWKPKHELAFVKKHKGGFDVVAGQFKQNKKSFKKILDKEYQYIEIGCVNVSDGSMEPMKLQGSELPANAKIKFQEGDVIVSKVRPYRGAVGIVNNDDYVGSGAFTLLQENGVVN